MAETLNSLDLPGAPADTRVVVAMSGGVDSSVVAGLLKAEGYDVVGVTLQLYDHGAAVHRKGACCAGQDIHDARRVAERLDIPHYVLDYEKRFRETVIDKFADSYMAGETPVPCIACNQTIKFHDLLGTARQLGAQAMATGHYIATRPLDGGGRGLFSAVDADRDQSYFLFTTTPSQAEFLRFPLGAMTKAEVRRHAAAMGLAVADKPDSQDICFVPTGHYAQTIEKLRPEAGEPGEIVHLDGRRLGTHKGIIHYTIGQRRGIGVATGEPLYVIDLDPVRRTVIVGPRDALNTSRILLKSLNWIGQDMPSLGDGEALDVLARVRSTRPPAPARLLRDGGEVIVELANGEDGISPGQACVLYDGDRLLGGGYIREAVNRFLSEPRRMAAV